ncbi:MAG: hypothetical protein E6K80_01400, partial [Candidatus Eisenbacteria bacterium]
MLLGSLAGAGIVLANCFPATLEQRYDVDFLLGTLPLGRAIDFWGSTVNALPDALMKGLGSFALLLLVRLILRRDAAAWVGLGVLWMSISLPSWNVPVIQWISMAAAAACFVLAARVGLVAATTAAVVSNLLTVCTSLTL